jgi:hypothetical protein
MARSLGFPTDMPCPACDGQGENTLSEKGAAVVLAIPCPHCARKGNLTRDQAEHLIEHYQEAIYVDERRVMDMKGKLLALMRERTKWGLIEPSRDLGDSPTPFDDPPISLPTISSPKPRGRPKNSTRGGPGQTIRLAPNVYSKALELALQHHMPLSKYLSRLLGPVIEEEARVLIAKEQTTPGNV